MEYNNFKPDFKTSIEILLCDIGVPVYLKGFHIIRNMVLIMYDYSKTIGEAYEIAAQMDTDNGFPSTRSSIGRNMNHAIRRCFTSELGVQKREKVFRGTYYYMSNREFLQYVILYLKQQNRVV